MLHLNTMTSFPNYFPQDSENRYFEPTASSTAVSFAPTPALATQYMPTAFDSTFGVQQQQQQQHQQFQDQAFASYAPSSVRSRVSSSGWPQQQQQQQQQQQKQPRHRGLLRHQRQPSGSSAATPEPASPYTPTTSYPHIVDVESHQYPTFQHAFDTLPVNLRKTFLASSTTFSDSLASPALQQSFSDGLDHKYGLSMSQPGVDRYTAAQHHMMTGNATFEDEGDAGFKSAVGSMPKLDRTISDYYQDELYNPPSVASASRSAATPRNQTQMLSPQVDMCAARLQEANQDHMSARSSSPPDTLAGDLSPFRVGSEHTADGVAPTSVSPLRSSARLREEQKADADAAELAQHRIRDVDPPATISPREAGLEIDPSVDFGTARLIGDTIPPAHRRVKAPTRLSLVSNKSSSSAMSDAMKSQPRALATPRERSSNYAALSPDIDMSTTSSIRSLSDVPQQYPFISLRQRSLAKQADVPPDFSANPGSMDSNAGDLAHDSSADDLGDLERPDSTSADSGTYTCTYHGCVTRFATAQLLQKHKRTVHRQSTPQHPHANASTSAAAASPSSPLSAAAAAAVANRNSQAGPHKCERINPSTNKPCNSIFSRPYDLTRHEDTIHNGMKQKVGCQFCTDDKTFSRRDALSRHMRVVHPEISWEGKQKRRV